MLVQGAQPNLFKMRAQLKHNSWQLFSVLYAHNDALGSIWSNREKNNSNNNNFENYIILTAENMLEPKHAAREDNVGEAIRITVNAGHVDFIVACF